MTPKASHFCYCTMITQNERLRMIRAARRSFSARKLTRDIFYRNYGNFNAHQFLINPETNVFLESQCWDHLSYENPTKIFKRCTRKTCVFEETTGLWYPDYVYNKTAW